MTAETLPGEYDYVIVGAGSAGCVLANRLSADPTARVLLLEAGGSDRHPHVLAPAGFLKTFRNPHFNWRFETEPGPGVDGRAIFFPRGKALGGSSSINGSLWVRGQARDFDTWAQRGCTGWSWAEVLPAFRSIEDHAGGADEWRGSGGPQHVSAIAERHPICEAFIAGAAECGLPLNPDHNGARQEGAFYYQRSIRRGRRHSAATGFLRPALRRPNLRVETGALALRLEIEGRRVSALLFRQHGRERRVHAGREVLLAAGAVGSPHLLQLSGMGPAEHLASLGIPVAHDLPGVGENLQDHYATRVVHAVTRPVTLNERARMPRLGWEVARWLLTGGGLPGMSPAHAGAFLRSRKGLEDPDLQFVFTPASYSAEGVTGALQRTPGMTIGVWQTRPESRGHVRARSPDPAAAAAIQPNYLSAPEDRAAAVAGLRWARRLMATEALAPSAARKRCPAATPRTMRPCWPTRGRAAPPCTTPSAPAAWAPIRWPWWTRGCACGAWTVCAWRTHR